jgi:hypothetical protein
MEVARATSPPMRSSMRRSTPAMGESVHSSVATDYCALREIRRLHDLHPSGDEMLGRRRSDCAREQPMADVHDAMAAAPANQAMIPVADSC